MAQHCIAENSMQCCLNGSRQHCIKKILFNVVLIHFGQHCTGRNPMQCLIGSKQYCIRKDPVQCSLNTLRQHWATEKTMQYCLRDSRQHCIKIFQYNFDLILLGKHCLRKMFHSTLAACAILVLCNVLSEAPSNIAQKKIQAMQEILSEHYLVTLFTYVICIYHILHVKKI